MPSPSVRLTASIEDRYRIERQLGQGGMATVYLAQDTRHQRSVALKVLRADLAAVIGAERFLQEIRTTANLQHPHILPLHDSGEVDGTVFYVMPFVEGESLRDCLTRERQLPIDDALRIASEVASALDYAHRHGVIHRDIKPENILLHDGQALVADFGIALAASRAEGGTRMTETGMSLGTPHYMSPEQALGERTIDARADIYALGCVVYEMLTGEPPFTGATVQAIVAKVMSATPERPSVIRSTVPPGVEAAVLRALSKLPADRFRTASDFSAALSAPATQGHPSIPISSVRADAAAVVARPAEWHRYVPWGVAALALVVAGLVAFRRPAPPAASITRSIIPLDFANPPSVPLNEIGRPFDLSSDGRFVVYVAADPDSVGETSLWIRYLDRLDAKPIAGTRGAHSPLISPDGRRILFAERRSLLNTNSFRVVEREGGVSRLAAARSEAVRVEGWMRDGSLLMRTVGGIWRTLSVDGAARGDSLLRRPGFNALTFASDERAFAFGRSAQGIDSIGLGRIGDSVRTIIVGTSPRFIDDRHLIYRAADGTLSVVPVDLRALKTDGLPRPFVESIAESGSRGALFAVAADGSLLYATGAAVGLGHLVWVDRSGKEERTGPREPAIYGSVALSPDDARVAVTKGALFVGAGDVWVLNFATGSSVPVTTDGQAARPVWTTDGNALLFPYGARGLVAGRRGVARRAADGSGPLDTLLTYDTRVDPADGLRAIGEVVPSPDGAHAAIRVTRAGAEANTRDILYVKLTAADSMTPFANEPAQERGPRFSPDGKWLLYVSDRTGRDEVYAERFPARGGRVAISVDGGREAVWSRDGSEIFYRSLDGYMTGARLARRGDALDVVRRERLFPAAGYLDNQFLTMYDVARDGRFLMVKLEQQAGRTDLVLVRNWRTEVDSVLGRRR